MSLIKCPECGHEVSSKAVVCPNCGVDIAGNVKRCPVCKRFLLMDAEECPQCHTRFVVTQSDSEPPAVPAETAAEPEAHIEAQPSANESNSAELLPPGDNGDGATIKPRRKWWKPVLLLVAIIAVAAGCAYYWLQQNRMHAEAHDYEMLRDCSTPAYFEDFLNRFPDSPHVAEVRQRLTDILAEDSLWAALTTGRIERDSMQRFVGQHPASPHLKAALAAIDSIDWHEADIQGSSSAYSQYIDAHPDGNYLDEAYIAKENARMREERALRDSLAAAADSLAEVQVTGVPGAR